MSCRQATFLNRLQLLVMGCATVCLNACYRPSPVALATLTVSEGGTYAPDNTPVQPAELATALAAKRVADIEFAVAAPR